MSVCPSVYLSVRLSVCLSFSWSITHLFRMQTFSHLTRESVPWLVCPSVCRLPKLFLALTVYHRLRTHRWPNGPCYGYMGEKAQMKKKFVLQEHLCIILRENEQNKTYHSASFSYGNIEKSQNWLISFAYLRHFEWTTRLTRCILCGSICIQASSYMYKPSKKTCALKKSCPLGIWLQPNK